MQPLKEVIRALTAKKSLGQHFLLDPHILKRIVESAAPLDARTVIEQDSRCLPYLDALKSHFKGQMTLMHDNALTLSLHTLGSPPRKIISNLPYNISVPLLLQWLQHIEFFESLTLMFQKEVAARIVAVPNTPDYGRLSVMCQAYAHIKKLFDLSPGAFLPPPKVTSTVIQLTPIVSRETPPPWEILEKVVKAAFSQRRKMLRSSLKGILSIPQLESVHINPECRAEDLSVLEKEKTFSELTPS
jgi:16S rRNA (adenine1518-N6/adenine1519-N6)-dimethyltransferase